MTPILALPSSAARLHSMFTRQPLAILRIRHGAQHDRYQDISRPRCY